ncbi:MAG: DUF4304 domain-containing protein [Aureispira sp.]
MQDTFKEIINQAIKPLLKVAKFKKKALNFYKSKQGLVYLINIQKSHGSSSQELGFYVNCCIHSNVIAQELEQTIIEFPKEYQCHFRERIERLSKNAPDQFLIRPSTNIDQLKAQISRSFEEVVQYFEAINNHASFVSLLSKKGSLKQDDIFRYCIKKGLATEANTLVALFKKNIDDDRWEDFFKKRFSEILAEENSEMKIELLQA